MNCTAVHTRSRKACCSLRILPGHAAVQCLEKPPQGRLREKLRHLQNPGQKGGAHHKTQLVSRPETHIPNIPNIPSSIAKKNRYASRTRVTRLTLMI